MDFNNTPEDDLLAAVDKVEDDLPGDELLPPVQFGGVLLASLEVRRQKPEPALAPTVAGVPERHLLEEKGKLGQQFDFLKKILQRRSFP